MLRVSGRLQKGCGHFGPRMRKFAHLFQEATGERLFPGTLNVKMDRSVPFEEHFQIVELVGEEFGWQGPVRFEICRIDRLWAYRIKGHLIPSSRKLPMLSASPRLKATPWNYSSLGMSNRHPRRCRDSSHCGRFCGDGGDNFDFAK